MIARTRPVIPGLLLTLALLLPLAACGGPRPTVSTTTTTMTTVLPLR